MHTELAPGLHVGSTGVAGSPFSVISRCLPISVGRDLDEKPSSWILKWPFGMIRILALQVAANLPRHNAGPFEKFSWEGVDVECSMHSISLIKWDQVFLLPHLFSGSGLSSHSWWLCFPHESQGNYTCFQRLFSHLKYRVTEEQKWKENRDLPPVHLLSKSLKQLRVSQTKVMSQELHWSLLLG